MTPTLKPPLESTALLAQILVRAGSKAYLEVHEDRCFRADTHVRVGVIEAHPEPCESGGELDAVTKAIGSGAYSWSIPSFTKLQDDTNAAFHPPPSSGGRQRTDVDRDKARRALEAIVHCAVRCGFVNPIFDAGSISEMPFVRPTTLVVDTSAILQGGLDFVIRSLYPMARIKIPAIVHMELLNQADGYFKLRRSDGGLKHPARTLLDHVTSQGGQRVLLRLELQTDAEIERPRLGADPLRGVVQPDHDAEDKSLGLQQVQRSFADRLILETAIQHRERLSPDHPISVLTADQGLARMTLGEGLHPLFFSAPHVDTVCGSILTGTPFRPFVSHNSDSPYFSIPLVLLLWELASTFGQARLISDDGSIFMVSAIGDHLNWYPYHSRDDLLWTGVSLAPSIIDPNTQTRTDDDNNVIEADQKLAGSEASSLGTEVESTQLKGAYRFQVPAMLNLVLSLERKSKLSDTDGMAIVGLSTTKRYSDLRNFLLAGKFAERPSGNVLVKTPRLDDLARAFKAKDVTTLQHLVTEVPTYKAFLDELRIGSAVKRDAVTTIAQSAVITYVSLAEVLCSAVEIVGEGIYRSSMAPTAREFAEIAIDTYNRLRDGEEFLLTGRWLEDLVRIHGIHPVTARERLTEARESGFLERYAEGSTPDTRFERHSIDTLDIANGQPVIRKINLYHGDFLLPGKATVSIRLEDRLK